MWSAAVTITPPAVEPMSLEAAKQFCRVDADETGFDDELGVLIAGARGDVEAIAGTRLITQTVRVSADGFADLARLPIGPVQEVVSIAYLDPAGQAQTLAADNYEVFGAGLEQAILPAFGTSWPVAAQRAGAVTVELSVGYGYDASALPGEVLVALLQAVRAKFDDRPFDVEGRLVNHRVWL